MKKKELKKKQVANYYNWRYWVLCWDAQMIYSPPPYLFTLCPGQPERRVVAACCFLSFTEVFLLRLPRSPEQRGTVLSRSFPATPCVLVNYRSGQVINPVHFMHSLCCTSPLKSQYLCFPFNLAIYLGCFNRNYQASQLKHGNSGMLNLKSAVPKSSISAAIWGLRFLKMCVLAKSVKAQYASKSFMGNLIQTTVHIDYNHVSDTILLRLHRPKSLLEKRLCVQIPNGFSKQDQHK